MKFKVKPSPQIWDLKTLIRFAYFPTRIYDTIVWLENYECTYRYTKEKFWGYNYWEKLNKNIINK
jgi:hypothetical protein